MTKKTFLLGLGNQKCGTTWLHHYLNQSERFNGGLAKEYHVFDVLDYPELISRRRAGLWKRLAGSKTERLRFDMQHRPSRYFNYFKDLYRGGVTLSADITPSYSGLGAERLSFIRDQFDRRGITAKAVILIRDPVSRVKSAVRFNMDRGNYGEGISRGLTFEQTLAQYYPSEYCRMRTDYVAPITRALSVFGTENVYVGVYESMFEPDEIIRLSQFCGVEKRPEMASVKVNKTKSKAADNTALEGEIRRYYGKVYDYCHECFPETRRLWS